MKKLLFSLALLGFFSLTNAQETVNVIGWNIESGGMNGEVIAGQIEDARGVDIWGISEMPNSSNLEDRFELAAEAGENADFETFLGSTGGDDRLMIIYNTDKLDLINIEELDEINIQNSGRAPLVAEFELRSDGTRFFFMVNHLFRRNREKRYAQSRLLNEWMATRDLPVIAAGDYNYDWEVNGGDSDHDRGYDLLTAGDFVEWVRPQNLIRTQCSATSDGGCRYNSVLDFIFTSNMPQSWEATSEILTRPGDFPDDRTTSDHRLVAGKFVITQGPTDCETVKEELRVRIQNIETELEALKRLLAQLDGIVSNE